MISTGIGLTISAFCTLFLYVMFRYETRRGERFAKQIRSELDFLVLKSVHAVHRGVRYVMRDFIKQVGHYTFHTLLKWILIQVIRFEKHIRETMKVNRSLARFAERESTARNKLEEIALHKAKHALSDEEKREHKARALKGL